METEKTPHPQPEEREDDRLLDIWLFIFFALGVLIFALFAAPKGCQNDMLKKAAPQQEAPRS